MSFIFEHATPMSADPKDVQRAVAALLVLLATRQVDLAELRKMRDALLTVKAGHKLRGLPQVLEARLSVLDDVIRRVEAKIPLVALELQGPRELTYGPIEEEVLEID